MQGDRANLTSKVFKTQLWQSPRGMLNFYVHIKSIYPITTQSCSGRQAVWRALFRDAAGLRIHASAAQVKDQRASPIHASFSAPAHSVRFSSLGASRLRPYDLKGRRKRECPFTHVRRGEGRWTGAGCLLQPRWNTTSECYSGPQLERLQEMKALIHAPAACRRPAENLPATTATLRSPEWDDPF